jgi:hypothetical protein
MSQAEVQLYLFFFTSALDRGEWSLSCPSRFIVAKEPRYPLGPRACLDILDNRKIPCSYSESNLGSSSRSLITKPCTLSHPIPKLENHPLSAVRDCLFNVFADFLHIWSGDWEACTRLIWAQDRNRWRELANAVMNLRVPHNTGNFLTK